MVPEKPIRDRVRNYKNLKVKDLVIIGLRSKASNTYRLNSVYRAIPIRKGT